MGSAVNGSGLACSRQAQAALDGALSRVWPEPKCFQLFNRSDMEKCLKTYVIRTITALHCVKFPFAALLGAFKKARR